MKADVVRREWQGCGIKRNIPWVWGALICCFIASCGQTRIRKPSRMPEAELPRPGNIIVYNFAVNE